MYNNYSVLYVSYLPYFGGDYGISASAGAFYLRVSSSVDYSNTFLSGRLMFL